jgi:hypothetical protein
MLCRFLIGLCFLYGMSGIMGHEASAKIGGWHFDRAIEEQLLLGNLPTKQIGENDQEVSEQIGPARRFNESSLFVIYMKRRCQFLFGDNEVLPWRYNGPDRPSHHQMTRKPLEEMAVPFAGRGTDFAVEAGFTNHSWGGPKVSQDGDGECFGGKGMRFIDWIVWHKLQALDDNSGFIQAHIRVYRVPGGISTVPRGISGFLSDRERDLFMSPDCFSAANHSLSVERHSANVNHATTTPASAATTPAFSLLLAVVRAQILTDRLTFS